MDSRDYDLNIRGSYSNLWEKWEEKPESPRIRLGSLDDPLLHPDFLEILRSIKPSTIMTCGKILGTSKDPRKTTFIDGILESSSDVIVRYSRGCIKALRELSAGGIPFTVGVEVGEEGLERFWKDIWDDEKDFLLIPKLDINDQPEITITPDDLKDKENVKVMKYYPGILLTEKKIIITKDSINLKPLKVYDRF